MSFGARFASTLSQTQQISMKTFLRNLMRLKTAYLLSICGLSVAYAAFFILLAQVLYDVTFEHRTPHGERIFRLELADEGSHLANFCRPDCEQFIASSPLIEAGVISNSFASGTYLVVSTQEADGSLQQHGYIEDITPCSPDLGKVFDFDMVEGTADVLHQPAHILLPQSLARKFYGSQSAIGQIIEIKQSVYGCTTRTWIVGGVYKDFPSNTQLQNRIYAPMDPEFDLYSWKRQNYTLFVRLQHEDDVASVLENWHSHVVATREDDSKDYVYELVSLPDMYFAEPCLYDEDFAHGSRTTTFILLSIALLILVLATINYTNFSMALVPFRIRAINTRKVLGSSDAQLRRGLTADAVWTSLLSALISFLLVHLITLFGGQSLLQASIALKDNGLLALGVVVLSVLVGALAGLYPARYTTSFSPALVLKGSFGLSPRGLRLRKILVSIQFIISLTLISCSLFMQGQNRYMRKAPLGFQTENIAVVSVSPSLTGSKETLLEERLGKLPQVTGVAFSQSVFCSADAYQHWGMTFRDGMIDFEAMIVSASLPEVLGIRIYQGRSFLPSDHLVPHEMFLFNRSAQETYQMTLDDKMQSFYDGEEPGIVGFCEDFRVFSMRRSVGPMALVTYSKTQDNSPLYSAIYVRYAPGTDATQLADDIQAIVCEMDPLYPTTIQFFDQIISNRYQNDVRFENTIKAFTLLAILICMMGVFGLVLFDTQQRRKEIVLRRINGATEKEILLLFSKSYVWLTCICFVISIPLTVFIMSQWMQPFAQRISLANPIMYIVSLALVLGITLLTVCTQVLRAVRANPVLTSSC